MRRAVLIAAVALLVLGACGSDDDDDAGGADTSPETTEASAAPVQLAGQVNEEGTGDASGEDEFALELDDFYFGPTYVKVTSGQTLTIELENEGDAPHTFTIDAIGVDEQVEPGQAATVEVELPDAEAVAFYCKFHKERGMQGAFYVREGASVSEPTVTTPGSTETTGGGSSGGGSSGGTTGATGGGY
jgi:plastocyanin